MKKHFVKVYTVKRDKLPKALSVLAPDSYIIARYKEEPEGIILLANQDSIIDMIDDTIPKDAIFEIWMPEPEINSTLS